MKRVPFAAINTAKESDADAIKWIVRHFKRHITLRCLTYRIGADGHDHVFVDADLRDQAISALLSAIFAFHFKSPPDNFSL